jgi:hypothetical protein
MNESFFDSKRWLFTLINLNLSKNNKNIEENFFIFKLGVIIYKFLP